MSHQPVPFVKAHGTGNDFVIVTRDVFDRAGLLAIVADVCDRHRGVGADGVIVVEPRGEDVVAMQIYNRDGSRPQMCGNGVRCVARYVVEHANFPTQLTVLSDAGPRACTVFRHGEAVEVEVEMGEAVLGEVVGHRGWPLHEVDMGNPHGVAWVDEHPPLPVIDAVGAELNAEGSPFGDGVNVEFARQNGSNNFEVIVYERGVGRTQACGTGACAVAAAAWATGRAAPDGEVTVELAGGALRIRQSEGRVLMRGDAELVLRGELTAAWLRSRLEVVE